MGAVPASAWEELVKVSEASRTTATLDQLPEIILGAVGGALLVIILAIALFMHLRSAKAGTLGGKLKTAMTMTKSFYMPRKPKKAALRAYVLYDYEADTEGEIALTRGDRIEIVERPDEDGWGVGRLADGTEGRFPGNYVSIAEQRGMSIRERSVDRAKNRAKMTVQVRKRVRKREE
jgi:hypothetical protein